MRRLQVLTRWIAAGAVVVALGSIVWNQRSASTTEQRAQTTAQRELTRGIEETLRAQVREALAKEPTPERVRAACDAVMEDVGLSLRLRGEPEDFEKGVSWLRFLQLTDEQQEAIDQAENEEEKALEGLTLLIQGDLSAVYRDGNSFVLGIDYGWPRPSERVIDIWVALWQHREMKLPVEVHVYGDYGEPTAKGTYGERLKRCPVIRLWKPAANRLQRGGYLGEYRVLAYRDRGQDSRRTGGRR